MQGIITTGSVTSHILKRFFPESENRIIRSIDNDDADIFKLFLDLIRENRDLNIMRVFADLLDVGGIKLSDYLSQEQSRPYSVRLNERLADYNLAELMDMENHYANRHLRLWESGRIDMSITRFSNIVARLTEAGLKVHFAYPSLSYMSSVCFEAIQAVLMLSMRENQTAAIIAAPGRAMDTEQQQQWQIRLRQELLRFNKARQFEFLLRLTENGFEILTNRKTVITLTDNFRSCALMAFLKENLDFSVNVGYGLGETMLQSRDNAMYASREAAQAGPGSSCLINDRNELIGPLASAARLVVSRDNTPKSRLASVRSGLSPLTVRKILAAVESLGRNTVTSRELAYKLSITKRSANRFLSALWESGLAEVTEVRHGTTKGRPERIYAIHIDDLR